MNRREFVAGSLAVSAAAQSGPAWAQSGPLTKIIFPFAAGGSGDMLCRQLAEYLPAALDRKFIVENRTGGDGLIGIRAVKGSAPDTTTALGPFTAATSTANPSPAVSRARTSASAAPMASIAPPAGRACMSRPRAATSVAASARDRTPAA